jgi:hypothetical protein
MGLGKRNEKPRFQKPQADHAGEELERPPLFRQGKMTRVCYPELTQGATQSEKLRAKISHKVSPFVCLLANRVGTK